MKLRRKCDPKTFKRLERFLPNAAIEVVGHREELVIYTGLTALPDGRLVPMDELLD